VKIRRLLPRWLFLILQRARFRLRLVREFSADMSRYWSNSLPAHSNLGTARRSSKNFEAQMIMDYHSIEKGFAMPSPKRPFGARKAKQIDLGIPIGRKIGVSESVITDAASAQIALDAWNNGGSISDEVAPVAVRCDRGIVDADTFFVSRHSVRDFDDREVPENVLGRAVSLALQSPSVCNRQSWLIRFFKGDDVLRALAHQRGNAGFGQVVPVVALVTVDTRLFFGTGERNQPWIEGGIFSMSMVWALHALGLDTCMLNLSLGNKSVDQLRIEFDIPEHEVVIMMIAVGYGREGHRVARSPRRSRDSVDMSPTSSGETLTIANHGE
jgi:nitroreductase